MITVEEIRRAPGDPEFDSGLAVFVFGDLFEMSQKGSFLECRKICGARILQRKGRG